LRGADALPRRLGASHLQERSMKRLALPLALAAAALAGCADPYVSYGYGYGAYDYPGYAWNAWDRPFLAGSVASAPVFIEGREHRFGRFDRDRDRDGIPNRFDMHPNDPRRG
jgi:hypothetical protein